MHIYIYNGLRNSQGLKLVACSPPLSKDRPTGVSMESKWAGLRAPWPLRVRWGFGFPCFVAE